MYQTDLSDLRFIMWATGVNVPEGLGPACQSLFTLWKKLKKHAGKVPNLSDENAKRQFEAFVSEVRSNPAISMIRNWRDLGRPEDAPAPAGSMDASDIQRPHEHISSVTEVFKVQRRHATKTVVRFLNETEGFLASSQLTI
jgi:hypothetical protein